jgi:hypothetical protein
MTNCNECANFKPKEPEPELVKCEDCRFVRKEKEDYWTCGCNESIRSHLQVNRALSCTAGRPRLTKREAGILEAVRLLEKRVGMREIRRAADEISNHVGWPSIAAALHEIADACEGNL